MFSTMTLIGFIYTAIFSGSLRSLLVFQGYLEPVGDQKSRS